LLDGATHNDTYTNVALAFPNPDALQEFSVQTNNFSAESGRAAGAVVTAVTKSGTNSLHGSLFEFHRNGAVNARNFFAPTPDGLKRHQFGGTLGGPIWRDHTFFFFSHQETRQRSRPSDSSTTVLTEAQRSGDFSAFSGTITDPTTNQPFPGNLAAAYSKMGEQDDAVKALDEALKLEPGNLKWGSELDLQPRRAYKKIQTGRTP
jgi:hypothetical protein